MSLNTRLLCLMFLCLFPWVAKASPVDDPLLRRRLALMYAPEIRQDQKEKYGIGSIPYFLVKSDLMAELRGCTRAKRNALQTHNKRNGVPKTNHSAMAIRLGDGTWLSVRDIFQWRTDQTCDVRYAAFSTTNIKQGKRALLAAPNNLYLRFRQKDDATLLRGAFRFAVTPEISFRVYERQVQRCKRRNIMRLCVEDTIQRFYIIQYFVPLMYNDACNIHEGEHEGMVVAVDARKFAVARTPAAFREAIQRIGYYGHYKTKVFSPKDVDFVEDTHPIGYMGSLGHALYPKPGHTDMSKNFPFEVRPWVTRICRSRGLMSRLTEWHRGNGPIYRPWRLPEDPRAIERHGVDVPQGGWLDWRSVRMRGIFPSPRRTSPPSIHHKTLLPTHKPKKVVRVLEEKSTTPLAPPTSRPATLIPPTSRPTPLVRPQPPRPHTAPTTPQAATPKRTRPHHKRTRPHEVGLQPLSFQEKQTLSQKIAFTPRCLSPKEHPAVRVCDIQGGEANDKCCLGQMYKNHVRWVSFAGRWGNQEPFASGLRGAAAAQLGRIMKRWPLARSLGNSGPFGPRWIHQTTWHWRDPLQNPTPTPSLWR